MLYCDIVLFILFHLLVYCYVVMFYAVIQCNAFSATNISFVVRYTLEAFEVF